jgi:hypothetical protein
VPKALCEMLSSNSIKLTLDVDKITKRIEPNIYYDTEKIRKESKNM